MIFSNLPLVPWKGEERWLACRAVEMPDTPDGAPAGIEVVGLGKRFGPRTVLDDVTFSVPAGAPSGVSGIPTARQASHRSPPGQGTTGRFENIIRRG